MTSTMTTAPSQRRTAVETSLEKSICPGESIRLTRYSPSASPDQQPFNHHSLISWILHTCAGARAFNGPSSGITWVSRYQKGKKTNLDFTEARDSEWQWHQLGHMQVCTSLQTHKHASTPPLNFYRPDALSATQPTASTNWRHILNIIKNKKYTTMTTKQVDN